MRKFKIGDKVFIKKMPKEFYSSVGISPSIGNYYSGHQGKITKTRIKAISLKRPQYLVEYTDSHIEQKNIWYYEEELELYDDGSF